MTWIEYMPWSPYRTWFRWVPSLVGWIKFLIPSSSTTTVTCLAWNKHEKAGHSSAPNNQAIVPPHRGGIYPTEYSFQSIGYRSIINKIKGVRYRLPKSSIRLGLKASGKKRGRLKVNERAFKWRQSPYFFFSSGFFSSGLGFSFFFPKVINFASWTLVQVSIEF